MTAQHAAAGQLPLKYWAEARLQRWGHIAVPLSSTRVAIHGGYGRDGKKLRRLDDVVIVSSDGTVAPTVSSTPRPKARERHGAAAVDGGFVIHGGRAAGAFGDAWRWDRCVSLTARCRLVVLAKGPGNDMLAPPVVTPEATPRDRFPLAVADAYEEMFSEEERKWYSLADCRGDLAAVFPGAETLSAADAALFMRRMG